MDPNFWKDKTSAQKVLKEKKLQEHLIQSYNNSVNESKELSELYDLANEENNQSILSECFKRIEELKIKTKQNETQCFLSNESDIFDCYIEIHAGAGGTESQDWAAMLRRMYMKWSLSKEFKVQVISEHKGDEAGIKSSIIKINHQ